MHECVGEDGVSVENLQQVIKSFIDEDDGDETGERLLSEASDVGYEKAEVKCDKNHQYDEDPEAHPKAEGQEGDAIVPVHDVIHSRLEWFNIGSSAN